MNNHDFQIKNNLLKFIGNWVKVKNNVFQQQFKKLRGKVEKKSGQGEFKTDEEFKRSPRSNMDHTKPNLIRNVYFGIQEMMNEVENRAAA